MTAAVSEPSDAAATQSFNCCATTASRSKENSSYPSLDHRRQKLWDAVTVVSSNCCGRRRWVDEQQSDVDVRFSRQRLVDRSPISANTAVTG